MKKRKARAMTQQDLADCVKTTRQAVSKWENDETLPETAKLLLLAETFKCSVDELLGQPEKVKEHSFFESLKNNAGIIGCILCAMGGIDLVCFLVYAWMLNSTMAQMNGFSSVMSIMQTAQNLFLVVGVVIATLFLIVGITLLNLHKKRKKQDEIF